MKKTISIILIISSLCSMLGYANASEEKTMFSLNTNNLQGEVQYTVYEWMRTSYSRALITIVMGIDFCIEMKNQKNTDALQNWINMNASSYLFYSEDKIIGALYHGGEALEDKAVFVQYTIRDGVASYRIYTEEDGCFSEIKDKLAEKFGMEGVENNMDDMMKVYNLLL